ncbi:hypothetical protein V3C99_004220 [Haemonchus contortus]
MTLGFQWGLTEMARSRSRSRERRRRSRSGERKPRDRSRDRDDRNGKRRHSKERRSRSRSPYERRRSRSRDRRGRDDRRRRDDRDKQKQEPISLDQLVNCEQDISALMGFTGFNTTKNKKVHVNYDGAVKINKPRRYRQYMNRKGGFNRPLDYIA